MLIPRWWVVSGFNPFQNLLTPKDLVLVSSRGSNLSLLIIVKSIIETSSVDMADMIVYTISLLLLTVVAIVKKEFLLHAAGVVTVVLIANSFRTSGLFPKNLLTIV
jgi:hypothetical protein